MGDVSEVVSGLAQCYIAALPFFRNSLISETVCSVGIFSIMKFAVLRIYPNVFRIRLTDMTETSEEVCRY